ncbi:MAG: hypothetical protein KBI34_01675 [Dictyoglomi bacterium]|nr:hypothetical protein [Dictyoglomota bacterium]HHV81740.1 hypothetical protein [bacterium]
MMQILVRWGVKVGKKNGEELSTFLVFIMIKKDANAGDGEMVSQVKSRVLLESI